MSRMAAFVQGPPPKGMGSPGGTLRTSSGRRPLRVSSDQIVICQPTPKVPLPQTLAAQAL